MRVLIGILVMLHGLVFAIMFALPLSARIKAEMAPFDPTRSWLIGERPYVALPFALVVTALFLVTSASYLLQADWWPWPMLVACGLSLVLLALFASWYFAAGYVISIGLAAWAIWELARA